MARSSTSGQGRPLGAKNRATLELQDLARTYTSAAVIELARLAVGAESETARVAAINSLLDRGYGRPTQEATITHEGEITVRSAMLSQLDSFFIQADRPRLEDRSDENVVSN